MSKATLYTLILVISFLCSVIAFIALFFVRAPYGRYLRRGWGPTVSNRLGWLIMESPASILFGLLFVLGNVPKTLPWLLFLGMWEAHYIHRAFIYPFSLPDGRKHMPVAILLLGFIFNTGNAFLNGDYLFSASGNYSPAWLIDPRFIFGFILFVVGYITNRWSDQILRSLRAPGEIGYKIPYGGAFRWVSCPNYLGEIVEWVGWALATWCLPGLAFAAWSIANLAPRARAHHAWYRVHFPDYPQERKALVPGLW